MSGITTGESSVISFAAAGTDAGPREDVKGFSTVVAASADGRDAALNEGVRGIDSIVTVGAAETVCVLYAGVPGCFKDSHSCTQHGQKTIGTKRAASA